MGGVTACSVSTCVTSSSVVKQISISSINSEDCNLCFDVFFDLGQNHFIEGRDYFHLREGRFAMFDLTSVFGVLIIVIPCVHCELSLTLQGSAT